MAKCLKLTSEVSRPIADFYLLDELARRAASYALTFAEGLATPTKRRAPRSFRPNEAQCATQVLGYLETVHLRLRTWVVGLSDSDLAWTRPSERIRAATPAARRMPRVDSDSELAFARRLTNHWCRAARLSYSTTQAQLTIPRVE
jgi:hypothetical protein